MVSQHALQVVSQHALQVSRCTPKGEVEGSGLGGVSRPTPRGEVEGSGLGGIPACIEADTPSRRLLLWVVHILLECILVDYIISWRFTWVSPKFHVHLFHSSNKVNLGIN